MLGQPMSMLIPRVVGFKLVGELREGATATDLVLTVTERLRQHGVVGQFVEFYGQGIANLPLADRATIGNMSPEFGSTCAIFPIDAETLRYLEFSGRTPEHVERVEAYAKAQGMWHDADSEEATYSETLELDLAEVVPSLAGPEAPAGPGLADRGQAVVPAGARGPAADRAHGGRRAAARSRSRPRTRPATNGDSSHDHQPEPAGADAHGRRAGRRPRLRDRRADARGRHGDPARPRARRDRRDHVVHEHVEPVGDGRRRPARPQRGRARPARPSRGSRRRSPRAPRSSWSTTARRA